MLIALIQAMLSYRFVLLRADSRRVRYMIRTILFILFSGLILPPAFSGAFEDFFAAAKNDNADAIKSLLQRGMDPNLIEDARGDTALIVAAREGAMNAFTILLHARGTDLEAKAGNGDTALMIASFKGNQAAVKALLDKGAQVNRPGWTALHYAAAIGNREIMQMLLDKSADANAASPNRTTPMMMAARGGHILAVKLLLDRGGDASLENEQGMTAIDFAAKYEHPDIVEGLTYRLKQAEKRKKK